VKCYGTVSNADDYGDKAKVGYLNTAPNNVMV